MPSPLIPLERFFENPEKANAKISPDARQLAYLAPEEGRMNVWVRHLAAAGGTDTCVTHDHSRGIAEYFWTRDSTGIVYLQDQAGDENFHLFLADLARPAAPAIDLTPFPGVKTTVVAVPPEDPSAVVVATNARDRQMFDAHRLDLAARRLTMVAENPGDVVAWLADRGGRVRAALAETPAGDREVRVRSSEAEPFLTVASYANEDGARLFAFTPDGTALWAGSALGSDLERLVRLDAATGDETHVAGDEKADLAGPVVSERTGELLAATFVRDRLVTQVFDDRLLDDFDRLARVHPGDASVVSTDAAEQHLVVTFNHDRDPGATFLYDRRSGSAELLLRPYPWLDPDHLAPMAPVQVTSRDGLELHCYLTLPVGLEPRGLPMVLVVHGGPWTRDAWGYQPVVQFLANRGYAVLQVNYRGSVGFGKAFTHAAEHEFAGRMHDDLIDAVEWTVVQGYADRDRIGIYGASYGGYAALVGITFTPDVFAAAVSYVGPSSLVSLIRSFPDYWRPMLAATWFRYVGDPNDPAEEADMAARSPLSRVDRVRTPLLVAQGANDPRVTKAESDRIVAALRARGVEVEYLVKDDEGHGFANPENRMDLFRAVERFFARHLTPQRRPPLQGQRAVGVGRGRSDPRPTRPARRR